MASGVADRPSRVRGPLAAYLEAARCGGAGDDGLLQRFQLAVWPNWSGEFGDVDRWPDSPARGRAGALFRCRTAGAPERAGREWDGVPILRFNAAAQEVFAKWRVGLEERLRSGELAPALEAHLAKHRSLALLCHVADHAGGPVGALALERALAWAEYLEGQARRLYATALRPDLAAADALGRRFGLRDEYRREWARLAERATVAAAVAVLRDLDWLREGVEPSATGPRTVYLVNPAALARARREPRRAAREAQELGGGHGQNRQISGSVGFVGRLPGGRRFSVSRRRAARPGRPAGVTHEIRGSISAA